MYPYHNKIKQRIKNGELIKYEFVERYKNISPCLLLHFSTEPHIRPIRKHRFSEYKQLLPDFDALFDKNTDFDAENTDFSTQKTENQ